VVQQMASASEAWREIRGERRISAFQKVECWSSYPRMTLVSDFVAQKTGELFLFVNDAMPLMFMRTDKHYSNNRGSAKITLSRVQLSDSEPIVSHRDP